MKRAKDNQERTERAYLQDIGTVEQDKKKLKQKNSVLEKKVEDAMKVKDEVIKVKQEKQEKLDNEKRFFYFFNFFLQVLCGLQPLSLSLSLVD